MKPPIITVNTEDPLPRVGFYSERRVIPGPYSHTISAFGGYDTASFTLNTTKTEAEDWLENGLMRHVTVYAAALDVIWEGFINELRVVMGPLTVTHGPLLDSANRVAIMYSPLIHGDQGDVSGSQTVTGYANDTPSQAAYGIIPRIVSAGTMTDANALLLRSTYLNESKWPKTTESLSESNRPVSVTVKCKGYYHFLNWPYLDTTPGTSAAGGKIQTVLGDTPNSTWLTYGTFYMNSNALQVPSLEDGYRPALTVIQDVVARGDSSGNRWLFYILNNRDAYYLQAPTTIEYMARVSDQGLVIRSAEQAVIEPWRLLPGRWLSLDDFMVGRNFPSLSIPGSSLSEDPRLMFVEKVSYRAPFGLRVQGGKVDEISQVLAQLGVGGSA